MGKRETDAEIRSKTTKATAEPYAAFDALDGAHPWQTSVPQGSVLYPVRRLKRGRVLYFNFSLAKEMGLLPESHAERMNPALEGKLLDTFSIQIVNEFDQESKRKFDAGDIKPKQFMATRYLQLQHANKQGKTSGDGRSVWNGAFTRKGRTWDVSSRGTGVTQLSPGAVEAQRPLRTGSEDFGYGCGLADVDELVGSAILSEIFHWQGIGTERVLCVVDLGKGCGIGVRAAPNLIRPAHIFLYLKQGRREEATQAADYLIERQTLNKIWRFNPRAPDRYDCMLRETARDFARFAATLERNYIFAWLDWDGDNVLANAGIIDYGSIRQFGLRHDQYRYDDVTRFSTSLNEQKDKARLTVQVYAQLVDFIKTGRKRPLPEFRRCLATRIFDRSFERSLRLTFLAQLGLPAGVAERVLDNAPGAVERVYAAFSTLERQKTRARLKRVADGVNRPAIYNMRAAMRELPSLLKNSDWKGGRKGLVQASEVLRLMNSSHCKRRDLRLTPKLKSRIDRFLNAYADLMGVARLASDRSWAVFLEQSAAQAQDMNKDGRITGNGAEYVVTELLRAVRKGMSPADAQLAANLFIAHQIPSASAFAKKTPPSLLRGPVGELFQRLVALAFEHQEDI